MECNIFNIQKFSVNDGPGIRTTVFMKGCPLRCIWCHNPESHNRNAEILYNCEKCISCKMCEVVCKEGCHSFENGHIYDREKCIGCLECTEKCFSGALEGAGKKMQCEDIIKEVLKDKVFYENSGGGITLSGGEPMFQMDAALEILKLAKKEGIHTAMETSGYAKKEDFEKVMEYVDLFLFDYKETDPEKHKEFTGVSNEIILENLKFLNDRGADIILRCPLIPSLNDNENHINGIANIANTYENIKEVHIEPYHPLGVGKMKMLGKEVLYKEESFADKNLVDEILEKIKSKTKKDVKRG